MATSSMTLQFKQVYDKARAAVRVLEKGGRQSLLAEALTTHGIALARLALHDYAHQAFFHATEVTYQAGALNDAGMAALSAIEELGEHLTEDEMQTVYERADSWLEYSEHLATLQRLRQAAGRVLAAGRRQKDAGATHDNVEKESALREMLLRYEKRLIRQALRQAEGCVTQAARLLGITYQALNYMLEHRHRDLLITRSPKIKRSRKIIRKDDRTTS